MRAGLGFHETYWLDPTESAVRHPRRAVPGALHPDLRPPGPTTSADIVQRDDPADRGGRGGPPATRPSTTPPGTTAARRGQVRARSGPQGPAASRAYGQAIHDAFRKARARRGLGDAGLAGSAPTRGFWTPEAIARLPEPRARRPSLMVLDIGNDRYLPTIWAPAPPGVSAASAGSTATCTTTGAAIRSMATSTSRRRDPSRALAAQPRHPGRWPASGCSRRA